MGTSDFGLEKIGSYVLGLSPSPPAYCEFGIGSTTFNSGSYYLDNGIMRKSVNWSWLDGNPIGAVSLSTVEMTGSNIGEFGFGVGSSIGSDVYFRELSAIGTKDTSFDVELNMKVRIRRSV